MQYGVCNLSIVPVRSEPNDISELTSQVLYGEHFKILEVRKFWVRIRLAFDAYEGWIDSKQYTEITEEEFELLEQTPSRLSSDMVDFIEDEKESLYAITLGSSLTGLHLLKHQFDGQSISGVNPKSHLLNTAYLYLNAPYLWGGKSPFGIDSSGFTQMVYKLNGYKIMRDAPQQATQGTALSFIEESEPGDLAFFDNNEGEIVHVGIIMADNYIIHCDGKVRIDRLDHSGIYNVDRQIHTHKLRVIKKII